MTSARVLSVLVNALVSAFSCTPGPEERKGVYEENCDVEDMKAIETLLDLVPGSRRRVLDLIGLILWQCVSCIDVRWYEEDSTLKGRESACKHVSPVATLYSQLTQKDEEPFHQG